MSSEQRQLSLDEAIAQLSVLEEQINRLQTALADVERRIAVLSTVEEALDRLREGSEEAFAQLDDSGQVFIPVSVKKIEQVLVHAGLDVYVLLPLDRALEHVRALRADLSRVVDAYRRELAALTQYYTALRSAVEQALQRQARRT
jgi:prefoldin alpha subunit